MHTAKRALVADESSVMRQLLSKLLRSDSEEVVLAASLAEAVALLAEGVELALVDVDLPGGGIGGFFDALRESSAGRPRVVAMSRSPSAAQEAAVSAAGASGYLAKPIVLRDLARVLWLARAGASRKAPPRLSFRSRVSAVTLNEAGEPVVAWEVRDLSSTGALVMTEGALPIGQLLRLELRVAAARCTVTAKVARVAEPAWGSVSGVAVEFERRAGDDALPRFLEQAGQSPIAP